MASKQVKPIPAKVQEFAEKMKAAGFHLKNAHVRLPPTSKYSPLYDEALEKNGRFLRLFYGIKSIFTNDGLDLVGFPKNWYVFNRNENGEKSNFFVIVEYSKWHGLRVMFTDPLKVSEDGALLNRTKILRNLRYDAINPINFGKWADLAVKMIEEVASHKPEDHYFFQSHSHHGYSRGRLLMDLLVDDGRSRERDILANLVLSNMDFDATGPHNNFFLPLFRDMAALEKAVGIVKVPAVEVTMPIKLGDPNGPHVMMYATPSAMKIIQAKYLRKRNLDYPALAPLIAMEDFMGCLHSRFNFGENRKEVAFAVAHPVCDPALPHRVGLLAAVMEGIITLEKAEEIISKFVQGVACFNPTNPVRKSIPTYIPSHDDVLNMLEIGYEDAYQMALKEKERLEQLDLTLRAWVLKWSEKLGFLPYRTIDMLNMAFAYEMGKYGAVPLFDADSHHHPRIKANRDTIGPFLSGWNVIAGSVAHSPEGFIQALHDAKAGKISIYPEIFFEHEATSPVIARERTRMSITEHVQGVWGAYKVYGLHGVPILARDVAKALFGQASFRDAVNRIRSLYQ
ncbi:MAG: hypothetical protein PHS02_00755 [Candidatus ainarchaeum sp.]|nr:hypothetical protein [Candidatus ainarchaeum sp.]